MERLILAEMTWVEVQENMDQIEMVVIPVGSCEQHGPNTTFATDTVRADEFCKLLADRMGKRILVAPAVAYGMSPHHMGFPGTVTLRVETMINMLTDIVVSLQKHGFEKFIFVNGHGGNRPILDATVTKLKYEYDINSYWTGMGTPFAKEGMKDDFDFSAPIGHACEVETSQLLYLAPDHVRQELHKGQVQSEGLYMKKIFKDGGAPWDWKAEASANGALGDARMATVAKGQKMTELALEAVEELIETLLA